MPQSQEPRILAFVCNWCAYAGADMAGVARMQYPPNVRLIRLMCSGRLNHGFVLNAFRAGMDGVMVSGWHIGDCHYLEGNVKCQKVIEETRQILNLLGIDEQRLHLKWISASEGSAFAEEVRSFTQRLVQLGSLGLGTMTEEERQTATAAPHETASAVSQPVQMASA